MDGCVEYDLPIIYHSDEVLGARSSTAVMPSSSKDLSSKGKKRKSLPSGADSQPTPSDVKVVVSDPSSSAGPVFGESSSVTKPISRAVSLTIPLSLSELPLGSAVQEHLVHP
jgi:hypothetical protein